MPNELVVDKTLRLTHLYTWTSGLIKTETIHTKETKLWEKPRTISINQIYLKNWANVVDKICFDHP